MNSGAISCFLSLREREGVRGYVEAAGRRWQQIQNAMPSWLQRLTVASTAFFFVKGLVWTGIGVWVLMR